MSDSSKFMKSVVAFANGEGGRIIFGVDDKTHQVTGIPKELVFSVMDAITAAISDSCEPTIIPDVYLQQIEDKAVIVVEISPGKQRPYYIKSLGIKDGTYIRVAGTSRPADRDLTAEMYYEDEGRSYDNVVRRDLTVTEEEIQSLCRQMKEVAVRNARLEGQKASVKDVTKNQLLSWGLLGEGEDGKIHPTNGYIFLLGKDSFHSVIQCGVFKNNYSKIRNKALAHAFLYMNMIEEWGSGIPKLMREMKEYSLRGPEFIDMEIGFRVNLYRKQDEIPATELTNTDKIRNAIAGNPSVTQKELQELTGLSRSGVRYVLQQMWAAGKLDRIGSTKNGKWILKE